MKNKKNIIVIIAVLSILSILILSSNLTNKDKVVSESNDKLQANNGYGEKYFDTSKIMEINIDIDENELKDMFDNAKDEEHKNANVTINGDKYNNIAIRTKGNSSLNAVASDDESNRYSFKINFDKYEKNQTMSGLTQLNLNNCYSDPTYMREFIAYSIFKDMGLKTPEFAYAKIWINGEYHGLYLAVESILEPFIENNFEYTKGDLYKSTGKDGGALIYNGGSIDNYKNLELKSDSDADFQKVINMISALNSGEDIEKYLDVDSALKYIAINTAILNLDSYQGTFAHNYYLYEQNGKFTIIPWDFNMAFGGFQQGNSNSEELINIDSPSMVKLEQRPLINTLFSNEEYKEKYYNYLDEIVNKYLDSDYLKNMTEDIYNLISKDVKNDPSAFYTYEEFETNIKTSIENTKQNMGKNMNPPEGMDMFNKDNMDKQPPEDRGEMRNPNDMEKTEFPQGMELPEGVNEKFEENGMKEKGGKTQTLPGILELAEQISKSIKNQLNK